MKQAVYIETTIVSYLTSLPSRDIVIAAHQQITREWWQGCGKFEMYVSQLVIQEAGGGDPDAAKSRLKALEDINVLELGLEARSLANELVRQRAIPQKAALDAFHIAIAVVNGIDYLLTWNCTHIANASIRNKIERICRSERYDPPVICTPEELMEE
jgi:predicted nucleic acid-binding protein